MNTVMWSSLTARSRLAEFRSLWLTTAEAGYVLQIGADAVLRYVKDERLNGILRGSKGTRWLVSRGSLARFISYQEQRERQTRSDTGWRP